MTGILDRVAKRHPSTSQQRRYRPATPEHFFALRLASRLDDEAAVHHYIELCDRHSQDALLAAYRSVMASGGTADPGRAFNATVQQMNGDNGSLPLADLAAIRIERRGIAVAIFHGTRLKYPPIAHQLSSDGNKALSSAALFISRLREKCTFSSAALELLPPGCEVQRSQLANIIGEVLLQGQVAVHRFAKRDVLAAFGHPPLTFRSQVREVIAAIWPDVNGSYGGPLIKDALALGLYAQTERLFPQ
jgi:hypothetical protein